MSLQAPDQPSKAATGIGGLDEILGGGLPLGEMHLVYGGPGTGKTTIGLQFLVEGASRGEKTAFISLSQTEAALRKIAASHGMSLDRIEICDRSGMEGVSEVRQQTLFHTADVELGETVAAILGEVERLEPDRVVLDSIGQIRLLADTKLRYQRQLLTLREFFAKRATTVLIVDSSERSDQALADLVSGSIALERNVPDYGNVRRRLHITKMRGMGFHGGNHNFQIRTGGLEVYPRLEPWPDGEYDSGKPIKSDAEGVDALLGGGLEEGTACMIIGATGTGKTSLATLYAYAAAKRGERAAIFAFDERPETLFRRSKGLGMDLRPLADQGLITLRSISTAELSPGQFAQIVRGAVEDGQAKVVMIDSLTGYFHSMPQEEALVTQMHDLLTYLGQRGVLSLLVVAQHGMLGEELKGPIDVSYMADTVVVIRHFETEGSVRKAISVLKKRHGPHETTIRELKLAPGSIDVGEPIFDVVGVLSGRPVFRGRPGDLPG
jgi:circadian clock protein KaiC